MRIEHRQVEGQPLTVIIEYPKWSESVDNLVRKIGMMDIKKIFKRRSL